MAAQALREARYDGRLVLLGAEAERPLAIGAQPRTQLAAAAGIAVDNGILVDERLRTSAPDIFAAGDVASSIRS